jgi:hypothetical protein
MDIPNLRPLRLGEILDGAVGLYRRNFWLLVVVLFVLVYVLPIMLLLLLATAAG